MLSTLVGIWNFMALSAMMCSPKRVMFLSNLYQMANFLILVAPE